MIFFKGCMICKVYFSKCRILLGTFTLNLKQNTPNKKCCLWPTLSFHDSSSPDGQHKLWTYLLNVYVCYIGRLTRASGGKIRVDKRCLNISSDVSFNTTHLFFLYFLDEYILIYNLKYPITILVELDFHKD